MTELIQKEILSALDLNDFISLDIETTGLDYEREDIIEFGAVHFQEGKQVDRFNFFIKPTKAIPENITRITGITDSDVNTSSSYGEVIEPIQEFIKEYPIIAHNVKFDLPFLEYNARKFYDNFRDWNYQYKDYYYFKNQKIDTVILSKLFLHFLPSTSLNSLKKYFRFKTSVPHRALPDAEVTGRIFLELLKIALQTKLPDVQKIIKLLQPTDEPINDFFKKLAIVQSNGKFQIPAGINRESFSANANYFNIIGEDETPNHGKLEVKPIDEMEIADFFDESGELSNEFAVFEVRKPQVEMAHAIARTFNNSNFLVVEAGTGTGKSMAYLVPAIKWATSNYGPFGRIIISTNTKNLQEQLFFKDIPILHSIMKEKFKAVLLKGKNNYLCLDKWVTVMNDLQLRLTENERIRVLPLYLWVQQTETGDIAENNSFRVEKNGSLWSKFIAENNYCPGRSCKFYDKCFLMKARNNAKDAHLVLVNHSLLFSDLAADNAVLSDYVNVIFDEAHNIEKAATEYLGTEITLWNFREFFNKLYRKDKTEIGILIQLKKRLQLSDIKNLNKNVLIRSVEQLIEEILNGWRSTQAFYRLITEKLREKSPDSNEKFSTKYRYTREQNIFEDIQPFYDELCDTLIELQNGLKNIIEYFNDLPEESFEYQRQLYQELNAQFMQIELLINNLKFLISAEWDSYVYWYELPSKADSFDTRLYAAPLDVASILHEKLYEHLNTAVFTSATLAVDRNFNYFNRRVGIEYVDPERVEKLLLQSPFNYNDQVLLLVPSFINEPKESQYYQQIKNFIENLVTKVPHGTLALFTSYFMLNDIYRHLKPIFESEQIPVYGQGIDGGRHSIINQFKEVENSFLFGTDSFWEGVDVPGKSLEILLLTKLPFDVPTEPVIQAKAELIAKQGGNPFMDYTVPEAVIKFRQGFGRLIRSQSDYGAIIILDTRVIKKLYGRIFLNSLPLKANVLPHENQVWEQLQSWFGE